MTLPPTVPLATVRGYREADFEALVEIERTSQPSAWTRGQLRRLLARPGAECQVLERAGQIAGFLLLLDERTRWHLGNIAIAPAFRRQGLALLALRTLDETLATRPHPRVVLHVRESNLAAQLLYRKAGYRAVEILPRYYTDEPAYRMEKDLGRAPAR